MLLTKGGNDDISEFHFKELVPANFQSIHHNPAPVINEILYHKSIFSGFVSWLHLHHHQIHPELWIRDPQIMFSEYLNILQKWTKKNQIPIFRQQVRQRLESCFCPGRNRSLLFQSISYKLDFLYIQISLILHIQIKHP